MQQFSILITNDDGYFSEGIQKLREALTSLARVVMVAPDQDRSGVSHSLSISNPLRPRQVDEDAWALNGTPVDCIHVGLHAIFGENPPDLIVSGINHGPNLGEDTTYSGTVAGAYEGYVHGIPSFAISTGHFEGVYDFGKAMSVAVRFAKRILEGDQLLAGAVWNLNVPGGQNKGFKFTRLDRRSFKSSVVERINPRNETYYWLGPYHPTFDQGENTDYAYFRSGYVTATPLKVEMTDHQVLARVNAENEDQYTSLMHPETEA